MKSTLFASTLAAALTGTSFGQVEVELLDDCCPDSITGQPGWQYSFSNQILFFNTTNNYGYTTWDIQIPEETLVSFTLFWNTEYGEPRIIDSTNGPNVGLFAPMIDAWYALGGSSPAWNGSLLLPPGSYRVSFFEFEGLIDFGFEAEVQGSCCVNSGCSSTGETTCTELGGTWTEDGSCDDCEPVADDCPADVDGDGEIGFSDVLIILNDWGACP
mgnify:CR=1 FL=1